MTITLRVEKGAPLTIPEADGNIEDLDGRITDIEGTVITARSIEEIVQVGNSLIIQYTDNTEDGPFTFEVHITFRGDWEAATAYALNDLIHAAGVVYIVTFAHISEAVFDPGANDGIGNNYYQEFLSLPELQLPIGGGEGYVLAKASATDFDVEWQNRGVPDGGLAGQFLVKLTDDDLDVDWASAPSPAVAQISATVLPLDDPAFAGLYFRCTAAAGTTVTFLPDDELEYPAGTEISFRQCEGAGAVVLTSDITDGVTLNSIAGFDTVTAGEGAVVTAKKVATDEWDIFGYLAAVSA